MTILILKNKDVKVLDANNLFVLQFPSFYYFESEIIFPNFKCNMYEIKVLSKKLDYL